MKRILGGGLILLLVGSCARILLMQSPGESSIQGSVYSNQTYAITLSFTDLTGWEVLTEPSRIWRTFKVNSAIFGAFNASRLLFLAITLEDAGLEVSNEDYLSMVRMNMDPEFQEGLKEISLEQRMINGNDALISTIVHSQLGFTFTRAFFKRGTQNFSLMIWTPEDAYKRRYDEIHRIIGTFDFN